jgi:type II secretory pathway pseudopilin PulG
MRTVRYGERGFSIVEVMIAMTILMVVCGVVMRGVLSLTDVSRTVSNRTDMHNGVRNATELLTQEVGQAGQVALPGDVELAAGAAALTSSLTVNSTDGMFLGMQLLVGAGATQETVSVANAAGGVITLASPLSFDHNANERVAAVGGFSSGVVAPTETNGSTGDVLKIYGDIHDDGRMVYVEYTCDLDSGRLYRNAMPFEQAGKVAPTVEEVLIDNIEENPPNPDGSITPCFTYDSREANGRTYVIGVAITLTVRTQNLDKNTGDYQRETKALLNVSPRNVFNVWQMDGLGITNRIQPMPPSVIALLEDTYVTGQ